MIILAKNTQKKVKRIKYILYVKNSLFKENFQESVNLRIRNFGNLMINFGKHMDLKEN